MYLNLFYHPFTLVSYISYLMLKCHVIHINEFFLLPETLFLVRLKPAY